MIFVQSISATIWLVVCLCLFTSVFRVLMGNPKVNDEWRAVVFFATLLFIGFPVRRILSPDDLTTWRLLYAISISLALYVLRLLWVGRKG